MRIEPLKSNAYTAGQVAKICRVCVRTVHKWSDAGALKGFRLPGAKGDRRFLRADLQAFLAAHGLPADRLPGEPSAA